MAARLERRGQRAALGHRRVRRLQQHLAAALEAEARPVEGFLRVQTEVDQVRDEVQVALGLDRPSHRAEGHPRLAAAQQHARDDGVEGPLAGGERVPVSRFEAEARAATLEHDARLAAADARAEPGEEALDERDQVALAVGGAERDGVARQPRRRRLRGSLADARRATPRALLLEQRGHRHLGVLGIGHEDVAVGEAELHGLDAPVPVERARGIGGVETLEHVQRDQRGEALAVRRQLRHLDAAVARADRLDPARGVRREVVVGEQAVRRTRGADDRVGDLALVEGARTALRHGAERARELRRAEPLAGLRSARPPGAQSRARRGVEHARPLDPPPVVGDELAHREALLGGAESPARARRRGAAGRRRARASPTRGPRRAR